MIRLNDLNRASWFHVYGGIAMYALSRSHSWRMAQQQTERRVWLSEKATPINHKKRINEQLRHLGVSSLAMLRMECRTLYRIIHPHEIVHGVVYGHHNDGYALLAATDLRVLFYDKKPLFSNEDEVTYDVVSGVKLSSNGIGVTVTLHTKVKDYTIRTYNRRCAAGFVSYIESRRLEHAKGEQVYPRTHS